MKVIYSLKEFASLVEELAKKKNETYYSVRVDYSQHGRWEFGCYIHGSSWQTGRTMEESVSKMQETISPKPEPNIDVEVEMTDEAIEQPAEIAIVKNEFDDLPF